MSGEKWWDDDADDATEDDTDTSGIPRAPESPDDPTITPTTSPDAPTTRPDAPTTGPANGSDGPANGFDDAGRPHMMIRWAIGAGFVVLILAAVVVGVLLVGRGDSDADEATRPSTESEGRHDDVDRTERLETLLARTGWDDPDAGEIPAADDDETKAWLEGEGSGAVGLVVESEVLWSTGIESCEATADSLESIGSPEELLAAAAGTPDGPTSDILVNLYSSTAQTLAECNDPAVFEDAVAEFAWHWAVADRRLDELGVAR